MNKPSAVDKAGTLYMSTLMGILRDIDSRYKPKRLVETAYPTNEGEELFLILRGFERSIVGDYWCLYETIS